MRGAEKLIKTIQEQQITQVPRWRLRILAWLPGLLFAGSLLAGALACSVILFAVQQAEFNVLRHLGHSAAELLLGLLPLAWLGALAVFLLLSMYSLRHTRRGYKVGWLRMAGYNAALSLLLGTGFFMSGGAEWLEQVFDTRVSAYESIGDRKIRMWSAPERGLLCGTILRAGDQSLELQDFSGRPWLVHLDSAFIAPAVALEPGERIKLLGKMKGGTGFTAAEIRPWGGQGMQMHRRK
jgi:hypothetical protein